MDLLALELAAFSDGGGGQSTGVLILVGWRNDLKALIDAGMNEAADLEWQRIQEYIPNKAITRDQFIAIMNYPTFVWSNVGEDSEDPEAIAYINAYHRPFAAAHGIEFVEVRRTKRDGSAPTLLEHMESSARSIPIPVRMANGAPGNRSCTVDYKIIPVDKLLKKRGATPAKPARIGLGISVDEFTRVRTAEDSTAPFRMRHYPLIELRMRRSDCERIAEAAGFPPPPKSSCWFCPFHKLGVWQRMHDHRPVLFDKSVSLERMLNERRAMLGKDNVWLTPYNMPLDQVVQGHQAGMFDADDMCESGYCHT